MMTSNNALIPDPDKEDILASNPLDWPWMHLGLRMCGWGDNHVKYYLIGTPIIWWGGTLSLLAAIFALGVYLLRWQRKYVDMDARKLIVLSSVRGLSHIQTGEWDHFLYVCKIAFFGWAFHYGVSPFFWMWSAV
jgi:dolichyl-phosphate-mannose-protein mannosyltransferase